ncbi:hypothetical protein LSM04_006549 [Trypanosoma melophagium]|uniref:uncharacterized protein n=1 Tax=Trypanosoma melophagium TaxID=715481 RepID=UPI00351A374F|nr:hypothetical protein LSM04_006549 [Trypanosoma melophagium]
MALWSLEPHDRDGITARPSMHGAPYTYKLAAMVRDCLYELFNLVLFCFMAKHSASLVETVMEFTRREQYIHDTSSPYYSLCKVRHRRIATSYKKLWTLPSLPLLNEIPQKRKEKGKHYMHTSHCTSLSSLTNSSLRFTKPPEESSLVNDVLLEKRSRRKTNNVHFNSHD